MYQRYKATHEAVRKQHQITNMNEILSKAIARGSRNGCPLPLLMRQPIRQHLHHLCNLMGEISTHIKEKAYICICSLFSYACLLLKRTHLDHICTTILQTVDIQH